ncbi:hypothetical protein T492DRAFT_225457 [Pavlovales sp. CCMP2436]|nr:hypothetical protein T492DRAFT_225457 [Pavlovales sp. CCMP2436]
MRAPPRLPLPAVRPPACFSEPPAAGQGSARSPGAIGPRPTSFSAIFTMVFAHAKKTSTGQTGSATHPGVQAAAPQRQPQPSAVAPPRTLAVAAPGLSMQEQEQPPPAACLAATPAQGAVQPAPPSPSQPGTQLALLLDAERLAVSLDAEREDVGERSTQVASAMPPLSPVAPLPRTAAPLRGGDAARCGRVQVGRATLPPPAALPAPRQAPPTARAAGPHGTPSAWLLARIQAEAAKPAVAVQPLAPTPVKAGRVSAEPRPLQPAARSSAQPALGSAPGGAGPSSLGQAVVKQSSAETAPSAQPGGKRLADGQSDAQPVAMLARPSDRSLAEASGNGLLPLRAGAAGPPPKRRLIVIAGPEQMPPPPQRLAFGQRRAGPTGGSVAPRTTAGDSLAGSRPTKAEIVPAPLVPPPLPLVVAAGPDGGGAVARPAQRAVGALPAPVAPRAPALPAALPSGTCLLLLLAHRLGYVPPDNGLTNEEDGSLVFPPSKLALQQPIIELAEISSAASTTAAGDVVQCQNQAPPRPHRRSRSRSPSPGRAWRPRTYGNGGTWGRGRGQSPPPSRSPSPPRGSRPRGRLVNWSPHSRSRSPPRNGNGGTWGRGRSQSPSPSRSPSPPHARGLRARNTWTAQNTGEGGFSFVRASTRYASLFLCFFCFFALLCFFLFSILLCV